VKSTAALSHVDVQALNLMAALNMRVHEAFALVIHCMATMDGVVVCVNASTEAVLCEATHVLLVYLVPLREGLLDVLDEHAADGLQSILDVLVKFPGRLGNRLLNQALHHRFHLAGIAVSHSLDEVMCSGGGARSHQRRQEQWNKLHVASKRKTDKSPMEF
jgi:hypothetical protein